MIHFIVGNFAYTMVIGINIASIRDVRERALNSTIAIWWSLSCGYFCVQILLVITVNVEIFFCTKRWRSQWCTEIMVRVLPPELSVIHCCWNRAYLQTWEIDPQHWAKIGEQQLEQKFKRGSKKTLILHFQHCKKKGKGKN